VTAWYNEIDPFAAQKLRDLIHAGLIPDGEVCERSIKDVRPEDIRGYTQCHFFAGIGGWPYALRLAGWPDDRPVWTGSCPCQSFSAAGQGKGFDDPRHLWPSWYALIRELRPATIFGEQVDAAISHGWLDLVATDLETEGYAVGATVLPAASVGAPHGRHRLWFVADSNGKRRHVGSLLQQADEGGRDNRGQPEATGSGEVGRLANAQCNERDRRWTSEARDGGDPTREQHPGFCDALALADGVFPRRPEWWPVTGKQPPSGRGGAVKLGDALGARPQGYAGDGDNGAERSEPPRPVATASAPDGFPALEGFWKNVEWLYCTDGKYRPTQPGLRPLANGVPERVALLRCLGNAIVPEVGAEFVKIFMEYSSVPARLI
jgi:DNA (cytosine-5)-methyltransferase 1